MTTPMDSGRSDLIQKLEEASTRFQNGDYAGMSDFYADSEDITLLGALGGIARGRRVVETILKGAAARLTRGGDARYTVVAMDVEGDMAYMVGIESIEPAAEGLGKLRVTNVFRRFDGEWRLLHRHADVFRNSPFAG